MGHPFDELQLKKRFCLSKSVPFLVEIAWVSLVSRPPFHGLADWH